MSSGTLRRIATAAKGVFRIEVERRFCVSKTFNEVSGLSTSDTALKPLVLANAAGQVTLLPQSRHRIRDVYYDLDDRLASSGIWLRQRSVEIMERVKSRDPWTTQSTTARWEAKVRLSGDYVESQFQEIEGKRACREEVKHIIGLDFEDLLSTADFFTDRCLWSALARVDNLPGMHSATISVVVDQAFESGCAGVDGTNFSHQISELEVLADPDSATKTKASSSNAVKAQVAFALVKYLDEVVDLNRNLFPKTGEEPVGKLSAYFAWKQRAR